VCDVFLFTDLGEGCSSNSAGRNEKKLALGAGLLVSDTCGLAKIPSGGRSAA